MSKEKTDNTRHSQQTYKSKYKTAIKQGRDISIREIQSNSTQLNQHKSGNIQNTEFSDYKILSRPQTFACTYATTHNSVV